MLFMLRYVPETCDGRVLPAGVCQSEDKVFSRVTGCQQILYPFGCCKQRFCLFCRKRKRGFIKWAYTGPGKNRIYTWYRPCPSLKDSHAYMYYDVQADENKPVGMAFFLSVFNNYKSSFCSSYFLKFNLSNQSNCQNDLIFQKSRFSFTVFPYTYY